MRKILLDKNKGKESVNKENIIPINIDRDTSLFHDEILNETIDTLKLYNDEKNKSNKHRFIFTLTPICTNSLFNYLTEIIYKEGSDEAKSIFTGNTTITGTPISTNNINRKQLIRNTEYTNNEFNLKYHCGVDIFNNHLFRNNNFISIQKVNENKKCDVYKLNDDETISSTIERINPFNTIGDYLRNSEGKICKDIFPTSAYYVYKPYSLKSEPIYLYDTIKSFKKSYSENLKRKDGWLGFYNKTTMAIPIEKNGKNYYVNKIINNEESCKFIDLAPERDLFFFTPKKNNYRKRVEHNWDYCLTYPSESIYNDGNILIGEKKGLPLTPFDDGSLFEEHQTPAGTTYITFRSPIKHNLNVGDFINIKYTYDETTNNYNDIKCKIVQLGDIENKHKDRYFSILKDDIFNYIELDDVKTFRFGKIVSGYECEYYFRKFKKFNTDLKKTINRLAFSNSIYGDETSQLIFIDDIDVNNRRDNRNRPLTEVYLTILKRNKGYERWYKNNQYNHEEIEYSHVFGNLTSGLDLPPYAGKNLPTIRYQHNINKTSYSNLIINDSSIKLEDNIKIDTYNEFYGDLVEFNPVTINETVLEIVKHRFNTAQRETDNTRYNTISYDEIYGDNYDADRYNNTNDSNSRILENELNKGFANLDPEGYIYIPHHKIKIGEFSSIVTQGNDTSIIPTEININGNNIEFKTTINYKLLVFDIVSLQIFETNNLNNNFKYYRFEVSSYRRCEDGKYLCNAKILTPSSDLINDINNQDGVWFKHNQEIPEYAYILPDGTGRHVWRELIQPSDYSFNSELYKIPFTNNAFYHHTNIIFPVRRQDPFKIYDTTIKNSNGDILNNNFTISATELDVSDIEYIQELESTCF